MAGDSDMVMVPRAWLQGTRRMMDDALARLPGDAQGAKVSLIGAAMSLDALSLDKALSAPSTTSTAEQDIFDRIDAAFPDAPSPGEGEAPVASDAERLLNQLWSQIFDRTPEGDPKDTLRECRDAIRALSRPTPATPEGQRPFGLSPLEIERIRSALIEGLEKAYWAGSEVAQGYDAVKEADAILAAQAQGGE